jgi:hypothetical protein
MRMNTRTNAWALAACLVAGTALAGDARNVAFEAAVPHAGAAGFMIHGPLEGFEAKVVKGSPYSAEAVTEMTQSLADGNRIVRTNRGSVARDGEGRTRREQMLGALGPFMTDKAPRAAFLNDPVAGVHYVLELDEKIARKMPTPAVFRHEGGGAAGHRQVMHFQKRVMMNGAQLEDVRAEWSDGGGVGAKPATESLGERTIEGVTAEGTRTVVTIAAGAIGNEKPLEIVSERWYSPQIQAVVMSRHSDPRYGETTYRLTNISRDEPDSTLFTVPADFTVKEAPQGDVIKMIRRPKQD